VRLGLAVLALLVAIVTPACVGDDSGEGVEVRLRVRSVSDEAVKDADLIGAVALLEDRLEQAGIDASVELDSQQVVVGLDSTAGAAVVEKVVELATRRGVLELYDLETNLVSPSVNADLFPVATASLYELLVGSQAPAEREDEVESWYLFDAEKKLAGGPAPTKQLLLPNGGLRDGWRILGTPLGTVALACGVGEVVCPGVAVVNPRSDAFYLIRYEPPKAPELDGSDLERDGIRQDFDSITGEPIVTLQFTGAGADKFSEITRQEAVRGKQLSRMRGGNAEDALQHFAVVLDREIKSWPAVDYEQYPNGISGSSGIQISGLGSLKEADHLAAVLQSGALPVRFEVLGRP
jgi:hypothetical protein